MGLEIVIGLIVVALVGWAICEFKYKALPFEHAPEEEEGWEEFKSTWRQTATMSLTFAKSWLTTAQMASML